MIQNGRSDVKEFRCDGKGLLVTSPYDTLYAGALPARRSGPLYGAFPYATKISPETIALLIAAHTAPGDTVFDGFAGSGTTGLAALLCDAPTPELLRATKLIPVKVQWGARDAVLYELGALGAFIGETLTNPPPPRAFRGAAEEILSAADHDDGWMYDAHDLARHGGKIRHVVWSDLLRCPRCQRDVGLWDSCVSRAPAVIASRFTCHHCSYHVSLDEAERVIETTADEVLDCKRQVRARRPAWVYGSTGSSCWSRPINQGDLELLSRIDRAPLPDSVPVVAIPWGDLYRRGYHQGITHLHHFYTRRNLIVFTRLWDRANAYGGALAAALRFWLLSYNAAHATVMTRVVAKSRQPDLVVTSAQPGVLYVSGLAVEKNLIAGLRRKLSTITRAFEAWLERYTDRTEEAIISTTQNKALAEYRRLLTAALGEHHRVLKRDGKLTLVFHSASAKVWRALQGAYTDAGFAVECAGVLDKTQGSFKQVTTGGAVRGDPLLLLRKSSVMTGHRTESPWSVAEQLRMDAEVAIDPVEMTAQRLYSRLVAHYLSRHEEVPVDADSFYRWHRRQGTARGAEHAGRQRA